MSLSKNSKEAYEKEWKELQDWRLAMKYLDNNYNEKERWIIYQEFEDRYHKYLRAKYLK